MRAVIARALVSVFLLTGVGAALSACHHTYQGAKEDIHSDTR